MKQTMRNRLILITTLLVLLTGIISAVFIDVVVDSEAHDQRLSVTQAFFKQIVLTRRWVAQYGGVFVKATDDVEVNPYLEEIEGLKVNIVELNGEVYTLRNPALSTREISELATESGDFVFHITSLNPLNPDNYADEFEVRALQGFEEASSEEASKEAWEYTTIDGEPVFRYMGPLVTEESCLSCHTNYEAGDIRGGISVTIPAESFTFALSQSIWFYGAMLALSFIGILIFLSYIYGHYLTRPITELTHQTKTVADGDYHHKIEVDASDEIEVMASAVETLRLSMLHAIEDIQHKVDELERTNAALIQAETKATISKLVAGVAHNLNTPIGVSITVASFLSEEIQKIKIKLDGQTLTRKDFESFVENLESIGKTLEHNLENSKALVNSFKTIAVDQTSGQIRVFDLEDYLNLIVDSLKYKFKNKTIDIEIKVAPPIEVASYPGYISEVFNNLIMNSYIHGFSDVDHGKIVIQASSQVSSKASSDGDMITITYTDDGKGIPEDVGAQLYDMYFTTRIDSGGSGLGMHMVKKLIEDNLGGSIKWIPAQGIRFEIQLKQNMR